MYGEVNQHRDCKNLELLYHHRADLRQLWDTILVLYKVSCSGSVFYWVNSFRKVHFSSATLKKAKAAQNTSSAIKQNWALTYRRIWLNIEPQISLLNPNFWSWRRIKSLLKSLKPLAKMKGETVRSLSGTQDQTSNPGILGVTTAKHSYFLKRSMESLPGTDPLETKWHTQYCPTPVISFPYLQKLEKMETGLNLTWQHLHGAQQTLSAPAFMTAWMWISWRKIPLCELTRASSLCLPPKLFRLLACFPSSMLKHRGWVMRTTLMHHVRAVLRPKFWAI